MIARGAAARSVPVATAIAAVLVAALTGCSSQAAAYVRFTEVTHPVTTSAVPSGSGTASASAGAASTSAPASASAPTSTSAGAASASAPTSAPASGSATEGTLPPWPNAEHPADAIRAAGLTPASTEGSVEHYHAHLDILVDGAPMPVAAEIGIDRIEQVISPLHTHDTSGVIHIESPTAGTPYYLGQLFREWEVPLSASQLGGLHVDSAHSLVTYVDGKPVPGDPSKIKFAAKQEIALVYGKTGGSAPVPSTYSFAPGL